MKNVLIVCVSCLIIIHLCTMCGIFSLENAFSGEIDAGAGTFCNSSALTSPECDSMPSYCDDECSTDMQGNGNCIARGRQLSTYAICETTTDDNLHCIYDDDWQNNPAVCIEKGNCFKFFGEGGAACLTPGWVGCHGTFKCIRTES